MPATLDLLLDTLRNPRDCEHVTGLRRGAPHRVTDMLRPLGAARQVEALRSDPVAPGAGVRT